MSNTNSSATNGGGVVYTAKDFATDQDVRWCPGCGDYSILAQMQRTLPAMGIKTRRYSFRGRDWLFQQVSLLYEYIRDSFNSR